MYKVYWTSPVGNEPCSEDFNDLTSALAAAAFCRSLGRRFVTMVAEDINCTSKLGVDTVKDVKNYDGWISRKHDREV